MKTRNASLKYTVSFGVALVLGLGAGALWRPLPSAHADPGKKAACDQASGLGTWGFSLSGSIEGVGPVAGVGIETCDATGHCTGTETFTVPGATQVVTFTNDLTINPDCTGVSTLTLADNSQAHTAFVFVNDGTELAFIGTDPFETVSGVLKRR